MPNGCYSVSDIQDYIDYIIKKHETVPTNPLIYTYINRINNRLELHTPETMKLFDSTKN